MSAYSYIKEQVLVYLKPSRVAGVGIFALEDIKEGTLLFTPWSGSTGYYPITEEELQTFSTEKRKHIKDIFLYGPEFPADTSTYVFLTNNCHWIFTTPYYFVNSGGEGSNLDKDTLCTTRFIKKGQEILSNYGRYERNKQLL